MSQSAAHDLEATLKSAKAISGARPAFNPDPDVDRLTDMVMALAAELVVTRDRLDSVERLLETRDVLDRQAIESPELNERDDVVEERMAANEALLARVLRVMHQDIRTLEEQRADAHKEAAE